MDALQMMLDQKNWAVVGATQDTSKFGYKVYKKLLTHGYNVFPVNPKFQDVEGAVCYAGLKDVPEKIDVISMIVNPAIGIKVVEEAAELGIKYMWCQPGASDAALVEAARAKGISIVFDECVLMELH